MMYGLRIDGEIRISHCDSEKELWEEVDSYYRDQYPNSDWDSGEAFTHGWELKW